MMIGAMVTPWLLLWWIQLFCPRTVMAWLSSPNRQGLALRRRRQQQQQQQQISTNSFLCRASSSSLESDSNDANKDIMSDDDNDDDDLDPTRATRTTLSRRMEQIQLSSSSSSMLFDSHLLMDAAAAVTQQSCELLGIKSVGVDYGLVRTGLAATVGYEPKPLGILSGLNNTQVCDEVIRFCQSEQANQIVVGLPLHKNGTEAEQTNLTKIFANELASLVLCQLGPNVPVYMWDERYTSKFAAARAHSINPGQQLYGTLDADAACIILEHYYQKNGKGAHVVEINDPNVRGKCIEAWEVRRQQEEEANRIAKEQRIGGKSIQRQQAMERARKLEEELEKQGILGVSRRQKKKKKGKKKTKKQREPRTWVVPGENSSS